MNNTRFSTHERAPHTPYSISVLHWQSNVHTMAMDFFLISHACTIPCSTCVWEFVNFLTLTSRICLNCTWSENSMLTRDQVSQNRRFPPLFSPPSSASLTLYTTVQQSKRLNQSCDRIWGRYFCHKQSKTLEVVCVCVAIRSVLSETGLVNWSI